jgi:hypothetical protein
VSGKDDPAGVNGVFFFEGADVVVNFVAGELYIIPNIAATPQGLGGLGDTD